MNLDPRIKSKLDILSCFDIEKAKEFVGQKGYSEGLKNTLEWLNRIIP